MRNIGHKIWFPVGSGHSSQIVSHAQLNAFDQIRWQVEDSFKCIHCGKPALCRVCAACGKKAIHGAQ